MVLHALGIARVGGHQRDLRQGLRVMSSQRCRVVQDGEVFADYYIEVIVLVVRQHRATEPSFIRGEQRGLGPG